MLGTIEKIRIKNEVEKVLHVPGNYRGGILEFAIVFDYHLPVGTLKSISKELITILKAHSKVFQNARLNTIKWINDDQIVKEVSAMGFVQMGKIFDNYDDYREESKTKSYDELTRQLKIFYARSKIVFIITDNSYQIIHEEDVAHNLQPFLKKKIIKIII